MLGLNQETFGEYPSIHDLTLQKPHLLSPSQIKENIRPGREGLNKVEDQKFENSKIARNGDDLGWPTEAVELQSHVDWPKRADSTIKVPSRLSSSHGEWARAKLKLPNSVKLDSKLRFTTPASSALTLNESPETEKGKSETVQYEAKLQRRERKDNEARAAKVEKIRLKNLRDCAVCLDSFDKSQLIHPCHHYYCSDCLAGMPCVFCIRCI